MSRGELAKGCENLASDISFEAADNLGLAHSFPGAALHVCLGPILMTKPDHNDAIKSGIGLAVATAVEPMPVGLAGRSRYRIDPAERSEGSLRVEAFRVTPGSDQEVAAVSGPILKVPTRAGAAARVSRSSSAPRSWISAASWR